MVHLEKRPVNSLTFYSCDIRLFCIHLRKKWDLGVGWHMFMPRGGIPKQQTIPVTFMPGLTLRYKGGQFSQTLYAVPERSNTLTCERDDDQPDHFYLGVIPKKKHITI